MDHVGWTRRHTALYPLQLAQVLNPSGASAKLASATVDTAQQPWQDVNELKGFVCALSTDISRPPSVDILHNVNLYISYGRSFF